MSKKFLGVDVLVAARERIAYAFEECERVYVSFSGGKDSTVMLHLVMDEAISRGRKVGVLFIDLEGQYKLTVDLVRECLEMYAANVEPWWICLPLHLRNAVSVYEPFWVAWEPEKEPAWIRRPPEGAITDSSIFPFFRDGMEFEEFVPEFGEQYAEGKRCACFVGIRTAESLNRWRTLASRTKETLDGRQYTTRVTPNVYNFYPIYDWSTEDIWAYQGRNPDKPYNRLYDMMYRAGLTIHQARICQPYGDDQRRGLWLFHLIEPETWSRVVARVNGANSGAMYVRESGNISGYRRVSKPEGHTWQSFATLLLNSMPPKTYEHFQNKILLHIKWWMERGYAEGIPDEAEYALEAAKRVPSWRRVVKSLLRNDYWCKGLGFSQTKSDAYQKYLDLMKRRKEQWQIELLAPDPISTEPEPNVTPK